MKTFFLFFLCLLSSASLYGKDVVFSIHSSHQLLATVIDLAEYPKNSKVLIISEEKKELIAIGIVKTDYFEALPNGINIEIQEIVTNLMILPGDIVLPLNADTLKKYKIPGFNSLTLTTGKGIPAEYKELANFGVFTAEGHTLGKKEMLISPFQLQYGVTDDVTLRVVNALWLDGYANVGAKVNVLRNKWAKITVNGLGAYKLQAQDWIAQAGVVLTLPSNSKFQQHYIVNVTMDPQSRDADRTKGLNLFQDSDIRSITEYVTDSWDRILFGPVYNVELQTFGGTLSYMWIWNTFHASLGLGTRDLSNLTFGSHGYYYVYDIFWRF